MTHDQSLPVDWRDLLALTKPRVMSLVVFTALCGLLVAPVPIHPVLGFTAILCIALGAGAAAALNMWYEADLDAKMKRTASRPLPAGRMDRQTALHFGVGLAFFSVLLMGLATNWFAAAILAVSILFYVVVYTIWLKRRTPQNIVIGGAAGAFPPVIGWAAATGDAPLPIPPLHPDLLVDAAAFWALSLFVAPIMPPAGVPMLPVGLRPAVTASNSRSTPADGRRRVAPWPLGLAGAIYGVAPPRSAPFSFSSRSRCSPTGRRAGPMKPEKRLSSLTRSSICSPCSALLVLDRWILA
jgi:protoheme IX farnesyltransferase